MNHLKYLIVGSPRSGTTFMAKAFSSIGISCGHERIFGPSKIGKHSKLTLKLVEERLLRFSNLKAEASWYAVPFLSSHFNLINQDNIIIHVVRHPIAVIESLLAIKLFSRSSHDFSMNYALKRTPGIHKNDPEIVKCCKFYLHWNNKIHDSSMVSYRHRVEDNIVVLFDLLGLKFNHKQVFNDTKANTRNKLNREIISAKDIPNKQLLDKLENLSNLYGYNLYSKDILPILTESQEQIPSNNSNIQDEELTEMIVNSTKLLNWYRYKLQESTQNLAKYYQ